VATLVGDLEERERELDSLVGLIGSASAGSGSAALIEGEAGIGKTALAAAAAEAAANAGMTVLSARGGELESEFAWGVVRQLFDATVARAPARERSRLLGGAADLARPALGIEAAESPVDVSYATLHGLYWLTANVADTGPVLLAIDDVHWADTPSLRFVAHLLPRLSDLPILLLLASRPPIAEPASGAELLARIATEPTVVTLRPAVLSQAASTTLVRKQLAESTSEDVCLACHELSGGNPFLLRALMADLRDEYADPGTATAEHVRRLTPEAVSASVLVRLARLPAGARALARAVAILGAEAPFHTATALSGLDPDTAAGSSGALIRAGILTEDDALGFVHPLVRSAVYLDLSGPERSRWHTKAAHLLADDGMSAERVATQLVQCAPAGEQWAVDQLRRAAADARARGAPDVAATYLRRALAEPPAGEARGDVLFELGHVELLQDPPLAVPHLSEALEVVTEPRRRAEVALALGETLTFLGGLADAIPILGAGLAELDGEPPSQLGAALEAARLGAARWETSAQELRHELVRELRARDETGEQLDARLHTQLAIEAAAEGVDLAAAVRHARATIIARETATRTTAPVLPEALLVLVFADHAEEAREAIDSWLAMARERAWPLAAALGGSLATLGALYRGAVSEAVASGWGAALPGAEIRLAPVTVAFLVEALIERGEIDAARAELAERGLDGEVPYAWATTPLLLARGRLHTAAGDYAAAIRDLTDTGERAEAWGVRNPAMHAWRSSLVMALARVGERDRAIELAEEEIEQARRWGAARAIGVSLRAAGIAHGGDRGVELLRESVSVLESSSAPLEHARSLAELGSALRRARRPAEAREHLRQSLDLAHALGGIAVADRAREELTLAGGRPRRDALRGRDALTPSELRVAQLAGEGLSNREIAEALFVTRRTVELHLTSTYRKLEIGSRAELAESLAEG
jgi:DNA-binding CsgD family transcriptional regulator